MITNQVGGINDQRLLYRIGSIRTMGVPSLSDGKVTIADTSTTARVGDIFRAEDGNLQYLEIPVVSVSTNSFVIATTTLPANGNTFYLLRRVTQTATSGGSTASTALSVVDKKRHDYSSTSVSDSAYVTLIASTAAACTKITLFDSGGYAMKIATGAAASEVDLFYVPPGGFNGAIEIVVAAGTRLSVRCLETSTTVSVGQLVMNLIG
jgi:hypothetical protein